MSKLARVSLIAAVVLAVAGCGSTRFVVVDGAGGAGGAPSQATTATTAPGDTAAGTAAATPQPATDAEIKQFEAAMKQALTIDGRSFAERQKALDGSDDLEPTFAAVVKIAKDLGVKITIDSATVAGDQGTAVVTVVVSGDPFASGVPVPLVKKDGKWRVTRDGACAVLALGSPCPDAAAS